MVELQEFFADEMKRNFIRIRPFMNNDSSLLMKFVMSIDFLSKARYPFIQWIYIYIYIETGSKKYPRDSRMYNNWFITWTNYRGLFKYAIKLKIELSRLCSKELVTIGRLIFDAYERSCTRNDLSLAIYLDTEILLI